MHGVLTQAPEMSAIGEKEPREAQLWRDERLSKSSVASIGPKFDRLLLELRKEHTRIVKLLHDRGKSSSTSSEEVFNDVTPQSPTSSARFKILRKSSSGDSSWFSHLSGSGRSGAGERSVPLNRTPSSPRLVTKASGQQFLASVAFVPRSDNSSRTLRLHSPKIVQPAKPVSPRDKYLVEETPSQVLGNSSTTSGILNRSSTMGRRQTVADVPNFDDWKSEIDKVKTMGTKYHSEHSMESVSNYNTRIGKNLFELRRSKLFDQFCGGVIIINCMITGALAHVSATDHYYLDHPPLVLIVADKSCSVWFLTELIIRMTGGLRDFFCAGAKWWNIFDFLLVTIDGVENLTNFIIADSGTPVRNLTALRALRIFRVMRIIRLLQFFRDLQMMVRSIRMCGKSLVWALILVFLIIYLFALYFMQNVTDYLAINNRQSRTARDLSQQWGSLFAASYTLYMVMTGGVSWIEVSEPLLHIGWVHLLALFFYVFFTGFVVTNIITSIFVDTAIQNTNEDREEVINEKLQERDNQLAEMTMIFQEADKDGSGYVTRDEFEQHMRDPRVQAYLRSVGLDVMEAHSTFSLLDTGKTDQISITDFVFGCMRLKGTARSVDMAVLLHDSKVFHEMLEEYYEESKVFRDEQQQYFEELLCTLKRIDKELLQRLHKGSLDPEPHGSYRDRKRTTDCWRNLQEVQNRSPGAPRDPKELLRL